MKGRVLVVSAAAAAVLVAGVGPAAAAWKTDGSGSGAARAGQLQPPTASGFAYTSASTHLVWTAPNAGPVPSGYLVTRNGVTVCTTTKTSCTDVNLAPATTYTYLVSSTAGRYWVSATPLTMPATTAAGSFALSNLSPASTAAGVELSFTLSATFGFGTTDGEYTGAHRITITSSLPASPGGNMSGGELTPTFTAGVANKVATTVYGSGAQTLTVTDGSRTGSLAITVSPAAATTLELVDATNNTVVCAPNGHVQIAAGGRLNARVAVVDAYGNLAIADTALSVTLSYSGAGTLTPTALSIPIKASVSNASFTLTKSASSTAPGTLTINAAGTTLSTRCTIN